MRTQAYITSGILEKYVLGMANDEEAEEVLEMASQHLEIKEELWAIRKTLRGYLLSHQVSPPQELKEAVMEIANNKVAANMGNLKKEAKEYPVKVAGKKKKTEVSLAGIAALLLALALVAASFTVYSFYTDAETARNATAAADKQIDALRKELEEKEKVISTLQSQLGFYQDRDNQIIVLKGTRRSPATKATIYWNNKTRSAHIDLSVLPSLSDGKVAILWVNTGNRRFKKAGVLQPSTPEALLPLTYVENPKSFFVTAENNPDVERPNRARILMTGSL
ncbi:MAG TPA: hypothetical protein ENJ20_06815 [Bacteroidetes bacterium]|nr:hypothetical protein [Bacteroidota bacterium]